MSSPGLNVCPPEEPWQRPRVVTFYKNGDRSFRGKALRIPARRYLSLEALLVELSRWVPLANGVRRLYSPRGGRAVRSLAELRDGHGYVCAAFEPFRGGWYGPEAPGAAASGTEKQALFDDLSSELQEDNLQAIYPPIGRGTFGQSLPGATNRNTLLHKRGCCHAIHSDTIPAKPRIMTIIKASGQSHKKVTILLNRYCTQTFEQLISDIAEAMRHLHGKGECVKKLYNLKGKEVRSISDFYRGDDVFIAAGREQITMSDIKKVLRELYPKNPYAWSLIQRHWCHSEKPPYRRSEMRFKNAEVAQSEKQIAKKMEEVRTRVGQQERERARKWEQERWAREYRELDEIARQQKNDGNFDRDKEEMDKYQINKKEKKHKSKEKSRGTEKDIETYERGGKRVEEMKILQVGRTEWEEDGIEANSKQKMSYEFKEMERREVARNRNKWKEDKCDNEGEQPMKNIRWEQKSIKAEGETDKWDKVKPERQQGQKEDHQWRTEDKSHALRDENCKMSKQEDRKKCCCGQETSRDEEEQTWNDEEVEKAQNQPVKTIRMEQPLIKDHSIHSRETQLLMSRPQQSQPRREIEHYYEIGRTIGDGNFALVKECRLRNTEYEYAVKIIDKSKLKGKEVMIENEIAIVRSLSHPHIVRFIEEFETEGEIYLIMEYIHGGDLFDAITDSVKFTESNAALMMDNLCDALAYIHRKNIVHRDLKPENLLVQHKADGSPVLKLADFGLALKVTSPIFTVCGTPTYVAPEILSEKGYGFEVDMWATGVILYILLCGFPPFRSLERDQEELFEMIQLGEYEFLSPYWDSISDGAKDLVSKLLVVNPRNRYTAQQVLKHAWIWSAAKRNTHNLQREVSMNIGQHFRRCRRQEILNSATQRPSLRC